MCRVLVRPESPGCPEPPTSFSSSHPCVQMILPPGYRLCDGLHREVKSASVCAGSDLDSHVGTLSQGHSGCRSRLYTAQPGVGMAPSGVVLGTLFPTLGMIVTPTSTRIKRWESSRSEPGSSNVFNKQEFPAFHHFGVSLFVYPVSEVSPGAAS